MTLNSRALECHAVSASKGWHDEPRTFGDEMALLHSEVSEMLEEFRNGEDPSFAELRFDGDKPVGLVSEAVDVLIRLFDTAAEYGWDLDAAYEAKVAYNRTRPHRHGGKVL